MNTQFIGFPQDLFDFLIDLKLNNNRQWFNKNKARYQQSIVKPMICFIEQMAEVLPSISQSFIADTRLNGGSMFRIYRDTRFSKNKAPYKQNVGCQFRHISSKDVHAPGYYLHLEAGNVFVGVGTWLPPTATLFKIRSRIVEYPQEWQAVKTDKSLVDNFSKIEGDRLKLAPRGFSQDSVHINDLKLKSFVVTKTYQQNSALSPEFFDSIVQDFKTASPLMVFLTKAIGVSF